MRIAILTSILLLLGCCKNPVEPEVLTDVCIDTFSPAGGTTVTLRPGEPIVWPVLEPPVVVVMEGQAVGCRP